MRAFWDTHEFTPTIKYKMNEVKCIITNCGRGKWAWRVVDQLDERCRHGYAKTQVKARAAANKAKAALQAEL